MVLGLSLAGGGLRGSYQAGALTALYERGIEPNIIIGTSIGAIHGALLISQGCKALQDMWLLNDMRKVLTGNKPIQQLLSKGYIDSSNVKMMLKDNINPYLITNSKVELRVTMLDLDRMKFRVITLNKVNPKYILPLLFATVNIPLFKPEKILGKRLIDGGLYDILPTRNLISNCDKIIEIEMSGEPIVLKPKCYMNITTISPTSTLGKPLHIRQSDIVINYGRGYNDAKNMVQQVL